MASTINAKNTSTGVVITPDASGQLELQTADVTRLTLDTSGNLKFNSGYGSVETAYGCRAWVNFNGTGTVAIRASGNVTSITDNGTGQYTVNLTSSITDSNYSVNISVGGDGSTTAIQGQIGNGVTSSAIPLYGLNAAGTAFADLARICMALIR